MAWIVPLFVLHDKKGTRRYRVEAELQNHMGSICHLSTTRGTGGLHLIIHNHVAEMPRLS